MPFKILTTADLHLGRKSSSVPGHLVESSTMVTWHRMVNWAVKNQVDAVVLAGDVIDYNNHFYEAIGSIRQGLYFSTGIENLLSVTKLNPVLFDGEAVCNATLKQSTSLR